MTGTLSAGDKVRCSFGVGVIKSIREDGAYIVTLDNWALATGKSPVLYLNRASVSAADVAPSSSSAATVAIVAPSSDFKAGDKVRCSFGVGVIKSIREDGAHIVTLDNWALATGKSPVLYLNRASVSAADVAPSSSSAATVAIVAPSSDFKEGDKVRCSFGVGVLHGIREDGAHIVTLDNWALATGKSPILYLNRSSITSADVAPSSSSAAAAIAVTVAPSSDFKAGDKVKCSFGVGVLHGIREDGAHIVTLDNWALATGKSPVLYLNRASITAADVATASSAVTVAPSSDFKAGDKVKCSFGVGVLHGIREDGAHIVTLDNWALATGKSPILYLNRASITAADASPSSASVPTAADTASADATDGGKPEDKKKKRCVIS